MWIRIGNLYNLLIWVASIAKQMVVCLHVSVRVCVRAPRVHMYVCACSLCVKCNLSLTKWLSVALADVPFCRLRLSVNEIKQPPVTCIYSWLFTVHYNDSSAWSLVESVWLDQSMMALTFGIVLVAMYDVLPSMKKN